MDIAIVGRHTKVSEDVRDKIFEKMDKIESLATRATRAEVTVVHERNPKLSGDRERVEITLHGKGGIMRAEASADDRLAALEKAAMRITEQLRRLHDRRAKRHVGKPSLHEVVTDLQAHDDPAVTAGESPMESVETWEGAPHGATREVAIDGTPIVIRSKTHEAAPMTVAEAIDQMELVGHDFFLFHDTDSDRPSAVYRRRGWTYGVLHLETVDAPEPALETV